MNTTNHAQETEFSNEFGTVTKDRVTYFRKKGWFSGGSREDVPIRHVTSVRYEKTRSIGGGIVLLLIGLLTITFIIGIPIAFIGILLLWGSPTVVVNTSGGDKNIMTSLPWKNNNAQEFANAVRTRLFETN